MRSVEKFASHIDGEKNLRWLFRNLADQAAGLPTAGIPAARFDFVESEGLEACIRWEPKLAGPLIKISYGFYLYVFNTSLWIASHAPPFAALPEVNPDPFERAYSEQERSVWNPEIVIDYRQRERVFVPRYFRSRSGIISFIPKLVDPAAFFVLSHEIGHFVQGHWHLLASRLGSSLASHDDIYGAPAVNRSGRNPLWQANELDADQYAAMCVFGSMYFLCTRGMSKEQVAMFDVTTYQRHIELAFLSVVAMLINFNEGSHHPSGATRVLHLFLSVRSFADHKLFPDGVWSRDFVARLLLGIEVLGRLFGRAIPTASDVRAAFGTEEPIPGSVAEAWMALRATREQHGELLRSARAAAHESIRCRKLVMMSTSI